MKTRPRHSLGELLRTQGEAFFARHGGHLTSHQKKTLRVLAKCRTASLGGHVQRCLDCGHQRIAYNSCRNRHCPQCQSVQQAKWLEREAALLLPVEYHHVAFTVPHLLAEIMAAQPRLLHGLLLHSVQRTLLEVAANPKRLGARIGILAVLHTWGQTLQHHPHVHCVVTGGGLACDPQGKELMPHRWLSCRPGFFLPVRVLSRVFRGKFLDGLRRLHHQGKLSLQPSSLHQLVTQSCQVEWVVYAKPPFGGPAQTLKYLARYTHRVAIGNHRLVAITPGQVTFTCKDYARQGKTRLMTLNSDEFLRRFALHILPKGFVKIRHYGLLASRGRRACLETCRRLLAEVSQQVDPSSDDISVQPAPVPRCERCQSERVCCQWLLADGTLALNSS